MKRIISGGQTGVDRAALDVALELGIECGGWCPKGRKAEDGLIPDRYPLQEMPTAHYPARTRRNAESAHATLILAPVSDHSELTGGTRLTWDMAHDCGRLGAGLYLADVRTLDMVADCRKWLDECMDNRRTGFVLNVAGPRESKCPGIHDRAVAFLRKLLAKEPS